MKRECDKKVVAMVPIKLNNERLPHKNTLDLNGRPLIKWILNTLSQVSRIDDIYVFCSDETIIRYLPEKVRFLKRDKLLDEPSANFTQFFDAFYKQIDADIYVFTHATAPFVSSETINKCLDRVLSCKYDSAFTAIKIQDFLWLDGEPMNFDASNLPRSQDLEPIYRETSGVYVFQKDVFRDLNRRVGKNPYIAEVSWMEAVDINTREDYEMAQMVGQLITFRKQFTLIFDFDGVLIDSEAVQEYAFNYSYEQVVGDHKCPSFEEYMKHTGDSLTGILTKMGLPIEMAEPYRKISSEAIDKIIINDKAIEMIRKYENENPDLKVVICTGKDRKRTLDILKYFNIEELFDAVVCSDDVDKPKPSGVPVIQAIEAVNGMRTRTLMIGDGYNDILSANNAGIKSVLTLWYGDRKVPRIADYVVNTIEELEAVINENMEGNK